MGSLMAKGPRALGSGKPEGLQIKDQKKEVPIVPEMYVLILVAARESYLFFCC